MNDATTFRTRRDALDHIATMRGWSARPVRIVTDDGPRWAIDCGGGRYMRTDGFVR